MFLRSFLTPMAVYMIKVAISQRFFNPDRSLSRDKKKKSVKVTEFQPKWLKNKKKLWINDEMKVSF